jgi:hypothetical protein
LAERAAPPEAPSAFADFGTAAHRLFAQALRFELATELVTDDPLVALPLNLALDAARRILDRRPFMVELRLPALPGLNTVWGTADVVGFTPAGPVDTIIDLKFGENIAVEADTPQLGVYGLLAARCFGAAEGGITTWVLQPRCAHPSGHFARRYHYSLDALDRLETRLREAAAAAFIPNAPRHAGDWCRWCRAASTCPERQAMPDAVPRAVSNFFRPRPAWL